MKLYSTFLSLTSLVAQMIKRLPTMRETWIQSLGQEDLLEKEMAPHSSILAWKIPWIEEPGKLQSMGSQNRTWLHFHFSLTYFIKHNVNFLQVHSGCYIQQNFLFFFFKSLSSIPLYVCTCMKLKVLFTHSCLTLYNPVDCSLPGSTVHGILQARILEWVAIPFSRRSSWCRDWTLVSCIAGAFFTIWATREIHMCIHTCTHTYHILIWIALLWKAHG